MTRTLPFVSPMYSAPRTARRYRPAHARRGFAAGAPARCAIALVCAVLVVGGLPMKWIAAAGGIAAAGVAAIMLVPSLHERAMERITIWKNPASDPLGTGYQILQSLYAIGSGGLMGSGIGNSRQKYLFLPEPQNDYVFSVVCEELGFIGALVVIVLFALLTWRGFTIVIKARDRSGAQIGAGEG